eukprot:SAG31_NODE_25184_length_466_cov_1.103542_1_plen_94_part_01
MSLQLQVPHTRLTVGPRWSTIPREKGKSCAVPCRVLCGQLKATAAFGAARRADSVAASGDSRHSHSSSAAIMGPAVSYAAAMARSMLLLAASHR